MEIDRSREGGEGIGPELENGVPHFIRIAAPQPPPFLALDTKNAELVARRERESWSCSLLEMESGRGTGLAGRRLAPFIVYNYHNTPHCVTF